jgi:hypothetical protein
MHTNFLACRTIAMLLRRSVHRNILCNTRPVVGGNRLSTYYTSQRTYQSLDWITGKHYCLLKVYSACFYYILGSCKFWQKYVFRICTCSLWIQKAPLILMLVTITATVAPWHHDDEINQCSINWQQEARQPVFKTVPCRVLMHPPNCRTDYNESRNAICKAPNSPG